MTPQDFAYWLQGFVELNGGAQPTPAQWAAITDHLKLVFQKETPSRIEPLITPIIEPDKNGWDLGQRPRQWWKLPRIDTQTWCSVSVSDPNTQVLC